MIEANLFLGAAPTTSRSPSTGTAARGRPARARASRRSCPRRSRSAPCSARRAGSTRLSSRFERGSETHVPMLGPPIDRGCEVNVCCGGVRARGPFVCRTRRWGEGSSCTPRWMGCALRKIRLGMYPSCRVSNSQSFRYNRLFASDDSGFTNFWPSNAKTRLLCDVVCG